MQCSLESLLVIYETHSETPAFEVLQTAVPLLKAFHEKLSVISSLKMSDLNVIGGTSLSDVVIRVTMFDGASIFEVTPEKLAATFRTLRSSEHG